MQVKGSHKLGAEGTEFIGPGFGPAMEMRERWGVLVVFHTKGEQEPQDAGLTADDGKQKNPIPDGKSEGRQGAGAARLPGTSGGLPLPASKRPEQEAWPGTQGGSPRSPAAGQKGLASARSRESEECAERVWSGAEGRGRVFPGLRSVGD